MAGARSSRQPWTVATNGRPGRQRDRRRGRRAWRRAARAGSPRGSRPAAARGRSAARRASRARRRRGGARRRGRARDRVPSTRQANVMRDAGRMDRRGRVLRHPLRASAEGIAKITINRPEVRNAFRPETLIELSDAFEQAREDTEVGVIVLTGEGPDAFCSGGDQRVRGDTGYVDGRRERRALPRHRPARADPPPAQAGRGDGRGLRDRRRPRAAPRLRPHDRRRQRALRPDRAARRLLRRRLRRRRCWRGLVGPKKAKEIWFLCRQYDAQQALEMGLVNTVVPLERLEEETVQWCREMLALSPFALRLLKASFHAAEDGLAGIQQLAHDANLLFYVSEEAQEGRDAYKEKRTPDFSAFPPPCRERGSRAPRRIWLMAARPRTLPAAVAPVLVGTALAATEDTFKVADLPGRAARRAVHPGRHEPLQRLLRRPPRRRHRGPARPGAGHRGRARAAAPGAGRDLRGVRRWRCSPAPT